jgi:endoglucanase
MNRAWFLAAIAVCAVPGCIPNAVPQTPAEIAASKSKCPAEGMIDDAEDNNNQVMANAGRSGYWYTFSDKSTNIVPAAGGTFTMSAGGANGSAHAAHMNGKVGTAQTVYGGMGFNFVDPKGAYDASKYGGISFWAKAGSGTTKVRLKVPDSNTDPDGKVCTECFNDFGVDLQLSNAWTQYQIAFGEMSQMEGWGAPHTGAINKKKIYGVQFQVNSPGSAYDIWVDDVEFIGCK